MARILIVYHSQTGNTRQMAEAVARGVTDEGSVAALKQAFDCTPSDLIECDGLVLASPEYFGYMAGAIKDFFDRTYEELREHPKVTRKPYCIVISAGNDGQGAVMQIERICKGYRFKRVQKPIVSKGTVTQEVLAACAEVGRVLAAGCEAGVF
ncbi:MAG TPA: flavodoxin [Deltaproteobacteria bacterium]|nr:flavodoxin [Deltaproteobacteria bacterium]